jgi:hypothetical protein
MNQSTLEFGPVVESDPSLACGAAASYSPDKRMLSLMFNWTQGLNGDPSSQRQLQARTPAQEAAALTSGPVEDPALSSVRAYTAHVPLTLSDNESLLGYSCDLRGFLGKDRDTRAWLMVEAGSTVKMREFPFEEEYEGDFSLSLFNLQRRPSQEEQPRLSVIAPCTITVVVGVQRRSPENSVTVSIDSIDLALQTGTSR